MTPIQRRHDLAHRVVAGLIFRKGWELLSTHSRSGAEIGSTYIMSPSFLGELDKFVPTKYAQHGFCFTLGGLFCQKMSVSSKWVTGVTRVGPSENLGDHVTVTTKNTARFTGKSPSKKQHYNWVLHQPPKKIRVWHLNLNIMKISFT